MRGEGDVLVAARGIGAGQHGGDVGGGQRFGARGDAEANAASEHEWRFGRAGSRVGCRRARRQQRAQERGAGDQHGQPRLPDRIVDVGSDEIPFGAATPRESGELPRVGHPEDHPGHTGRLPARDQRGQVRGVVAERDHDVVAERPVSQRPRVTGRPEEHRVAIEITKRAGSARAQHEIRAVREATGVLTGADHHLCRGLDRHAPQRHALQVVVARGAQAEAGEPLNDVTRGQPLAARARAATFHRITREDARVLPEGDRIDRLGRDGSAGERAHHRQADREDARPGEG